MADEFLAFEDDLGASVVGGNGKIRIYHQTRDSHGETRMIKVAMPSAVVSQAERWMRNDPSKTFLSLHHLNLNALRLGYKALAQNGFDGLESVDLLFQQLLETEEARLKVESLDTMLSNWRTTLSKQLTAVQRAQAVADIVAMAESWDKRDPEIATRLRALITS